MNTTSGDLPTVKPEEFTEAMSKTANGVSIVTTAGEHGRAGLTVSSMCSVCVEPALVLACVNSDNEFCNLADANGHFAINLLTTDQTGISQVFAGLVNETSQDRFVTGHWITLSSGSPILDNALVALDCAIESAETHGSHRVYIGRVLAVSVGRGSPLVYSSRDYASTTPLTNL